MSSPDYQFSDEEYGEVLNNFVIGCVDTLVIYRDKVLLEKRSKDPIKGAWWIFGGRMIVGEGFRQTARRGLQRELGIDPAEDRFIEIGTFNLTWPTRREPDASKGCHHLLVAHKIQIDEFENKIITNLIKQNKLDAHWFSSSELSSLVILPELKLIIEKS